MSDESAAIPQVIGDNLWRARTARGWTMRQLADRLADIGTPLALSSISESERASETGRRITVEDMLRIALACNVAPVDLLTPESGSVEIAPDVPPIPNHAVAAWVSGEEPWPPNADRAEFLELADEHRRTVDATWNRPEMISLSVLTGMVRNANTSDTATDPAEHSKLLRREASVAVAVAAAGLPTPAERGG
jgi:transcriptional regulator with XRE-family HTH domain